MNSNFKRHYLLFVLFIFTACTSIKIADNHPIQSILINHYFKKNLNSALLYKANFHYKDHHFSGMLIIKKNSIESTRIQFLTNLGPTLFDLELTKSALEVRKILDALNKKIILNILEKDLRLLILDPLNKTYIQKIHKMKREGYKVKSNSSNYIVRLDEQNDILHFSKTGLFHKQKITATYANIENNIPKKINISHAQIDLGMELNYLKKY